MSFAQQPHSSSDHLVRGKDLARFDCLFLVDESGLLQCHFLQDLLQIFPIHQDEPLQKKKLFPKSLRQDESNRLVLFGGVKIIYNEPLSLALGWISLTSQDIL